jgi:hypothetical protein
MNGIVIIPLDQLEKILERLIQKNTTQKESHSNSDASDELNQKLAAKFLDVSQSTLIRWKRMGKVPFEQLPGSSKVTYYKSQLRTARQKLSNSAREHSKSKNIEE